LITLAWRCRRTNLGPQSRHEVDIKKLFKKWFIVRNHCHLKKSALWIQKMTIKESFQPHPIFSSLTRAILGSIDNNQALMKIIKLWRFWAQKFGWITPNVNINSWFENLPCNSSTRALVEFSLEPSPKGSLT
jgi:hypothetical protein